LPFFAIDFINLALLGMKIKLKVSAIEIIFIFLVRIFITLIEHARISENVDHQGLDLTVPRDDAKIRKDVKATPFDSPCMSEYF